MDAQNTLTVKAHGSIYDDCSAILEYAKDGGQIYTMVCAHSRV
ncbi:MAG: hypothetical protein AABY49_06135 [Planctomycetota bacterium]